MRARASIATALLVFELALVAGACASSTPASRERNAAAPALAGSRAATPAVTTPTAPTPTASATNATTPDAATSGGGAGSAESANPNASVRTGSDSIAPRATGLEIARVGGAPIDAAELLALWMHTESHALGDYVNKLVNTRLARLEAQRIGVRCGEREIDARYEEARADMRALVSREGAEPDLERYVRERLGLAPERYFARMRKQCEDQLLAERAVRAWLLASERAELRVIVVADATRAAEARAAIEGGLSFADAAKRFSLDDSRERGGHVPAVVRSERSPLAQLAFSTRPGELAGPLQQGGRLLLARVDAHLPAGPVRWEDASVEVLRSLAEQPVEEAEFWQWRGAMEQRYDVDLSGLLEIAR